MDKFVKLQERNLIKIWAEKTGQSMAKAKTELRDIMKSASAVEVKESTARIIKHILKIRKTNHERTNEPLWRTPHHKEMN